jgi:polyhydroxybutyrate depolymerase
VQVRRVSIAIICGLVLVQLGGVSPGRAAPQPFSDLAGSWYRYREAIADLQERGVLSGHPDGTFRPKDTLNRAEWLKMVFRGRSDVQPGTRRCFSDVAPDAWYAPYVCAAKARGIVQGYPNGTFKPEQPVNAAEAMKILLAAYGAAVEEGSGEAWYEPYVRYLDEQRIAPGHAYVPWDPLNRERAADLLWRVLRHEEDRLLPGLSPGCGQPAPRQSPTTVDVNGTAREILVTVPTGYVSQQPVPLVVAFHGRTNSNAMVRQYMRLDRELTDSLIVYPAALRATPSSFSWANPGDPPTAIRDVTFFDRIVEELGNMYCLDLDRISVVGHSLGAWMANTVACVRGDVVMASATVGGDSVITDCAGPAAAMIIHNPDDNLAPFSGAERVRRLRTAANNCAWEMVQSGPADLSCTRHPGCAGGNDVLWCPHTIDTDEQGNWYPHTWPRSTAGHMAAFLRGLR